MAKQRLLFIFVLLAQISVQAQDYQPLPAFPGAARDDAVAEIIDGYIYYGTGYDASFNPRNDFWRYSLESGEWEKLYPPPFSPRQYASSVVMDGYLYVIAGWSSPQEFHHEIWKLNTDSLRWEPSTPFPGGARWATVAAAWEGKLFIGLGRNNQERFKDWYAWDSKEDTWYMLPSFPGEPRSLAFAEAVNGKIWVGLGEDSDHNALSDLWVYDISTYQWSQVSAPGLPALKHPATAVVGDRIYIAGGESPDTLTTDLLEWDCYKRELTNLGNLGFRNARGGNMLSTGCDLYLLGGLSPNFERIQDFGRIDFPAFQAPAPEIFPNPTHGELSAHHAEEAENVQVFDLSGKMVLDTKAMCGETKFDVGELGAGVYLVRWCGDGGCSEAVKVSVLR